MERILSFIESISEGVKRFETEDCVAFGFGEGFDCSGDVVFIKDSFKFSTVEPPGWFYFRWVVADLISGAVAFHRGYHLSPDMATP
jgi:hypothetical protein